MNTSAGQPPLERAQAAQTVREHVSSAYQTLTEAGVPEHAVTLDRTRRWLEHHGPDQASPRAAAIAALWATLPAGHKPLQELASGLYRTRTLWTATPPSGRLAARLLAAANAPVADAAAAARTALTAGMWRQVWAAAGVSCDEVSATSWS